MPGISRIAIAACLGLLASGGGALAESISCPLSQARRTITDNLPSGWWTTPVINRLSDTSVRNIGGEPALICIYGNSGSIQRKAPDGKSCRAVSGGFDCTARTVVRVGTAGTANIRQTATFDFDNGRSGGSGVDIWFQARTASELYLVARNGAGISVGSASRRGYKGCRSVGTRRNPVALREFQPGRYFCVRTGDNRIVEFRVDGVSAGSPKTLSLSYTIWR